MIPEDVLRRLGGIADARTLTGHCSRGKVRAALARGTVVRDARGRYALPTADEALRAANRLSGVASHTSAAAIWGWELKHPPDRPTVTVPRNRKVLPPRRRGVQVRWADLAPEETAQARATSAGRTVMDCAKDLPYDEALTVADSALRHRNLTQDRLVDLAHAMHLRHRDRCLRVARAADGRAANPFESVLRAISHGIEGLVLVPQVVIAEEGWTGRPDLVDVDRRLVVEADSFEFHGHRSALTRDCERYNALVCRGWTVVRFAWEHVMFDPGYVADVLRSCRDREQQPLGRALDLGDEPVIA